MLDVDIVMNNYKKNRSKLKSKEEFLSKFILDSEDNIIKKTFRSF